MPRSTSARLRELDLVVLDDLDAVAVGVEEVETPAREDLGAGRGERAPRRLLVVDDEPEVPGAVRRLRAALHQRQELVADVDERRTCGATAQAQLEQAAVELERALEVLDLERDVVDADELAVSSSPPQGRIRCRSPNSCQR